MCQRYSIREKKRLQKRLRNAVVIHRVADAANQVRLPVFISAKIQALLFFAITFGEHTLAFGVETNLYGPAW